MQTLSSCMRRWLLLLAAGSFAFGCDDGGGEHAIAVSDKCNTFHACGGDVVGTWSLQEICYDQLDAQMAQVVNMVPPECSSGRKNSALHGSETITFEKDGTVSGNIDFTVTSSVVYTQKCVDALIMQSGGPHVALSEFCQTLDSSTNSGAGAPDISCRMSAAGCACNFSIALSESNLSGTYSVSGNSLIETDVMMMPDLSMSDSSANSDAGANEPSSMPFCVHGDTLTLSLERTDGISGQEVLRRQ